MPAQQQPYKPDWSRSVAGIVVAVLVLVSGFIITVLFGMVQGEELSPAGFQRRTFFYYEIPFVGGQISPVFRSTQTNSLENYLRKKNLISPGARSARWDVVRRSAVTSPQQLGAANELCAYLDMQDGNGDSIWLNWTKQHATLGKILWSSVAQMSAEKLYFIIPDMMESAQRADDPEGLRIELSEIIQDAQRLSASNPP